MGDSKTAVGQDGYDKTVRSRHTQGKYVRAVYNLRYLVQVSSKRMDKSVIGRKVANLKM